MYESVVSIAANYTSGVFVGYFTYDGWSARQRLPISRWNSKLNVLEKFIILRPVLAEVLPDEAPPVLPEFDDECISECVF